MRTDGIDGESLLAALNAKGCGACWKCVPGYQGMRVCGTCGNKRCPKASDHDNACTGSNDLGQPGSAYEHGAGEASARRFAAWAAQRPQGRSLVPIVTRLSACGEVA